MEESSQERPLVTFALFAYNQEKYIREAVEGACSQTYESLEIILSDDCSTDSTFSIMKEMADGYSGTHKIIVNRNSRNLGIGGHVNKIGGMASGSIVVMAAGDDVSNSNRVSRLISCYEEDTYAVFSDTYILREGKKLSFRSWIKNIRITLTDIIKGGGGVGSGAAYSYRKECFNFPWDYPSEIISEDRLLPMRAILLGKVKYLAEDLLFYRIHENNISTSNNFVMAKNNPRHIKEILETLDFVSNELDHNSSEYSSLAKARKVASVKLKKHNERIEKYADISLFSRFFREFHIFIFNKKSYYMIWRRRASRAMFNVLRISA